ncbi:MAG: winged helix-turn-helix transcriptional regulator [Euryarchaeota archaeon]|nr:winged helix-turn-helix transcriptional regulator [Euryarchaeota archaeon]MBU4607670.1 winged helix-turn-helix transcriptional regulator [Euryarchaeota archaeon]MBV1730461.1 winged helix-turn-helix transcriptional regulator [Methanobacterium sp.]MBV1755718.1 winged helix-turn-helix transcriptional regulator [Methanobacterium sp.]
MTKNSKNSTLKEILDIILYENPSTQDEIAEKLGITRRYVTKLLQPLVKKGIVRRAYILDLKKYDDFSDMFDEEKTSREHAGSYLIKDLLKNMSEHVCKQLKTSFEALISHKKDQANDALKMDFITNNMLEKVRSSVDTAIAINPYSEFSKTVVFGEIAYDLERIGDHSGIIANFTMQESYEVDSEMMDYLKEMYKTSKKMVSWSMDAFLNEKLDLKDEVMNCEDKLHQLQKKALNCIATQMAEIPFEDKDRSTYYLSLSRVVKAFERIGDISIEIIDTAGEFYHNIPRTTTPERFRRREQKIEKASRGE